MFVSILNLSDSPRWTVDWDAGSLCPGGKDDPLGRAGVRGRPAVPSARQGYVGARVQGM